MSRMMTDTERRALIEAQLMEQSRRAMTHVGRMFGQMPPEELAAAINAMGDALGVETRHATALLTEGRLP